MFAIHKITNEDEDDDANARGHQGYDKKKVKQSQVKEY
jgi:hypothetical protein